MSERGNIDSCSVDVRQIRNEPGESSSKNGKGRKMWDEDAKRDGFKSRAEV